MTSKKKYIDLVVYDEVDNMTQEDWNKIMELSGELHIEAMT